MNNITIFTLSLIAVAIAILTYKLVLSIASNYKFGQQQINSFIDRVNSLPFSLLIKKQGIKQRDYINHHQVHDIEKQVETCESCPFHLNQECSTNLQQADNIESIINQSILTSCPNQDEFENYINTAKQSN